MLITPDSLAAIAENTKEIKSVPVKIEEISLESIFFKPSTKKEITSVEPSLRLDAVASAGFGLSRSKMSKVIDGGNVLVNWAEMTNCAYKLQVTPFRLHFSNPPFLVV